MASTLKPERYTTFKDEIIDVARALADAQERLAKLVAYREENGNDKVKQLEKDNTQLRKRVKYLGAVNAELQRKAEARKPELERALQAREAEFRKVRHARKVIRDLVEEREKTRAEEERVISPTLSALSLGSLKDLLSSCKSSTSSSSRSGADSEKTVQNMVARPKKTASPPESPFSSPSQGASSPGIPGQNASEMAGGSNAASSSDSRSISVHPGSPAGSSRSEGEKWSICFSRPPKSATICKGPFTWDDLRRIFNLNSSMVATLQSLESARDLCMRVQIIKDIAFVYDPIFLESGKSSYFLDWGYKNVNEDIISHVKRYPVYNTFVFPKAKKNWFFIGSLQWRVAEGWDVYPTLGPKSRDEIVKKLKERCGEEDQKHIEELLSGGEVEQICIEMMKEDGEDELTRKFAKRLAAWTEKAIKRSSPPLKQ